MNDSNSYLVYLCKHTCNLIIGYFFHKVLINSITRYMSIRKFRDTCSSVMEEFLVPTHSHHWVQSLYLI